MSAVCPTEDAWRTYLGAGEANAALDTHLADCARCQDTLVRLTSGGDALKARISEQAAAPRREPAALIERVKGLIAAEGEGLQLEDFLEPSERIDVLGYLGGYEVMEEVARGGVGMVLRAFDRGLNREVALKVLAPELALHKTSRERFLQEARAAASIDHEHVLPIHRVEPSSVLPFFVVPFVIGDTLEALVAKTGPLPADEVRRIAAAIAGGLAAAHKQGLIHRDIKPGNILLDQSRERIWIVDFGIARLADAEEQGLARTGVITGSPQYMAPEQIDLGTVDVRTDLFSLGGVMLFMMSAAPPFGGESLTEIMMEVVGQPPAEVSCSDKQLKRWAYHLLEKDPDRRPSMAAVVAQALQERRSTRWRARRTAGQALGVGMLLLLVAAMLTFSQWWPLVNPKAAPIVTVEALRTAILQAVPGEVIQLAAEEYVLTETLYVANQDITLRAKPGISVVLVNAVEGPMIDSLGGKLCLENLSLHSRGQRFETLISKRKGSLFVRHCSLQVVRGELSRPVNSGSLFYLDSVDTAQVVDSEIIALDARLLGFARGSESVKAVKFSNCLLAVRAVGGLEINTAYRAEVTFDHCSIVADWGWLCAERSGPSTQHVTARHCVLAFDRALWISNPEAATDMRKAMRWQGEDNVWREGMPFVREGSGEQRPLVDAQVSTFTAAMDAKETRPLFLSLPAGWQELVAGHPEIAVERSAVANILSVVPEGVGCNLSAIGVR